MSKYVPNELELETIRFWEDKKVYEKLVKRNSEGKRFVHHDGPPYTTGEPGPHTTWNRCIKDMVRRLKRMQGFNVWDQPGFDTHGLPIEVSMEKELGLKNRREIEEYGTKKFIQGCKDFVGKYSEEMKKVFYRAGEWADWDNLYMAIHPYYMESMWWSLKQAYEKGLLYEGTKVLTWCPRCGTALAGNYEVVHENVKDNSVFVKFKVKGKENEYLLIWTTTPWTLPSNMAVMANPEIEYVKIKTGGEKWVLASGLVNAVMGLEGREYEIVEKFKGGELEGLAYEHPFIEEVPAQKKFEGEWIHKIILSNKYVDLSAGTGLVHCAPGCGPEDHEVGTAHGIPAFNPVDGSGTFTREAGAFKGWTAKIDDRKIVEMLDKKGLLYAQTMVEHSYPYCERCKSPVIFRVTDQWFLKVTKFRKRMIEANKKVNWIPDWAGKKSFRNWLQNIKDWGITRQRFWGTPFPLWLCDKCGKKRFIGSVKELKKFSGKEVEDLHKDVVDLVSWKCSCGGIFRRHPDIIDVWIDAACTPFASIGYPYRNKKLFEEELSEIDFLTESKDQFRGWFYALMAMSMVTFDKNLYENVYLHGYMTDLKGDFLSKRKSNYLPMSEILEKYGADVFRLYMLGASQPGVDVKFDETKMKETYRSLNVFWNTAEYFQRYSEFVGHKPGGKLPQKTEPVDEWILSKTNSLNEFVLEKTGEYALNEIPLAMHNFFVEDLSRSYIQFVRDDMSSGTSARRKAILEILFYVFKKTLPLFAPVCPFITERVYQNFKQYGLKELSVHHERLPKPDLKRVDTSLEKSMEKSREAVKNLLALREKNKVTLRWPLRRASVPFRLGKLAELVESQTNIKKIVAGRDYGLDLKTDDKLLGEGFSREIQRRIQDLRKRKGLKKGDMIDCVIVCGDNLKKLVRSFLHKVSLVVGAKTLQVVKQHDLEDYLSEEIKIRDEVVRVGIR